MWIGIALALRVAAGGDSGLEAGATAPIVVDAVAVDAVGAERDAAGLKPLAAGVAEIRFRDFFKPIGDYGLEFTDEMSALDGERVRIVGYMVRRNSLVPGQFILAPYPITTIESEAGFADDLPASAVWVHVPGRRPLPWRPGLMAVTGTLELGNREEPDGRVSAVRLSLQDMEAVGATVPPGR